jgi:hypothetical protein
VCLFSPRSKDLANLKVNWRPKTILFTDGSAIGDTEWAEGAMVELAETMLKLHKDLPKAKAPHEQESLKRTIAATDKQIDAMVYELYGPTREETRQWKAS